MAIYYFDTSAVIKRYVQEIGTAWVQGLASPITANSLFLVRITLAEMAAAITRQERGGNLSSQAAARALRDFEHDFSYQ